MPHFAIFTDDQHTSYLNLDTVCMFRTKAAGERGTLVVEHEEVEIEFINGTKAHLSGNAALQFVNVVITNFLVR
jgi:hypothetical protein